MSSKRNQRRKSCGAKLRYSSCEEAQRASVENGKKFKCRFSAYKCPFGDHWHVGHTSGRVKRFIASRKG